MRVSLTITPGLKIHTQKKTTIYYKIEPKSIKIYSNVEFKSITIKKFGDKTHLKIRFFLIKNNSNKNIIKTKHDYLN